METIPNEAQVNRVIYSPHFQGTCKIGDTPLWGIIHIEYNPKNLLLEFESVDKWIQWKLCAVPTTVEEVARMTFDHVLKTLGERVKLCVWVEAESTNHAPAIVEVHNLDKVHYSTRVRKPKRGD